MKLLFTALAALFAGSVAVSASEKSPAKPNIIVILTDDQDLHLNSMDYMPGVKKHLTDEGTYFNHHFATISLCCPSRANMWTGKAAHNTNVTDLSPPFGEILSIQPLLFDTDSIGGYPKFIQEGYNKKWLPVWLQEAGYQTFFTGKLMNGHSIENYKPKVADLALDGHDFMLEPGLPRSLLWPDQRH
jgi:N-acetylglucosamine-6-sulfatase